MPLTQVPSFGTEVKAATTTNKYHEVKTEVDGLHDDGDALLVSFSHFIARIADTTKPSFCAQLPTGGCIIEAETPPANTEAEHGSLNVKKHKVECLPGDHFCISFSEAETTTLPPASGALQLFVADEDTTTSLTLRLRASHGPLDAATHLLKLASALLSSHDIPTTLLSRFNVGIGLETAVETGPAQSPNLLTSGLADNPALVHTAFENQVATRPDNVLIDHLYRDEDSLLEGVQSLTYLDVHARATALAEQLVEIERYADWQPMIGQQRAVPILLPTCPELIIAILGVLKAGYAVCPLAVDRPAESLREVLADLHAVPVIGLGPDPLPHALGSSPSRHASKSRFLWIDLDNVGGWRSGRIATAPVPRPLSAPVPSDIAYVIFTSGSTGKPKGVLVPHRAMVASIGNFARRAAHLPTGPRLRWFVMNLPSFDAYQLDVLHVILRGGTLCMAERSLVLTDVEGTIDRLRATATTTVSSLAVILRPEKVPTLQTIVAGGEMLSQKVVANFSQSAPVSGKKRGLPTRHLINGYGPTETAIVVATEDMAVTTRGSIIGDALPSAIILIIEPQSESVSELPAGVPGELAIGGPQVTSGYLNRPTETAQAFVTHATLGRLYRTGDKARVVWTADGQRKIEILGRLTLDQVKINGRRMELGEVEAALLHVAHVREAAVVVVRGSMLAAFLVLRSDARATEDEVKAACQRRASEHLAPWMCPSSYYVAATLPRTPNDKIDRRELTRLLEERATVEKKEAEAARRIVPNDPIHTVNGLNGTQPHDSTGAIDFDHPAHTRLPPKTLLKPAFVASNAPFKSAFVEPTAASNAFPEKQDTSTEDAATELVYKGLAEAIGDGVRSHGRETLTSNIGLDSIRAMTLLRTLRADGVAGLTIMDALSASNIQDIINKVQGIILANARVLERHAGVNGRAGTLTPDSDQSARDAACQASSQNSMDGKSASGQKAFQIMSPDVLAQDEAAPVLSPDHLKAIPIDDEDAIYELNAQDKIRHYDYHCRATCVKALQLQDADIEQVLPATGIQMRLLYLATDPSFNDPQRFQGKPQIDHVLYQVPPDIDVSRLQRAIETIVSRHSIFRTLFVPTKHPLAEFAQVILSHDAPRAALQTRSLYVEGDAEHVATSPAWQEKLALVQEDAEKSLSLDSPSIRVAYVQSLDERQCVVVFSLFHAIYDGVAFRLFRAAVAAEYEGVNLPAPLLPFRSAVTEHLAADWLDTILFLMSRYANVPVFRTGRLRPRASLTREYDELHYKLYPSTSHMRRFSIQSRVTLNELMGHKHTGLPMSGQAVVQAAWTKMLSQTLRAGSPHAESHGGAPTYVEFTTAVHGRYSEGARRTMGPLLSGLPTMVPISEIRADGKTNRDVCNLLSQQHKTLLLHISMPCPNMEMAQVGMDRADTGLVLQIHDLEREDATAQLPDLPLFHHDANLLPPYKPLDTGFVIMVEVWPGVGGRDDNLTLLCSYNSQRPGYEFLSRSWVLSALASFDEAILEILSNPEAPFCAGPILVNGHD
ncbi:AMP-dependent synthetase ligase [Cordyceps militaris]|uniref:AMP-dependent synthetase ligase n=1 Tax=Cordyceps militaris TaxID=73501 RepID=A0A2H4SNU1_CORMI|nr:AMP-dependent synthetase ligase [Cordyceps militaris]